MTFYNRQQLLNIMGESLLPSESLLGV